MTVYVDDMRAPYKMKRWPYRKLIMSHMFCDPIEDFHALHRMVDIIGLSRRWFQGQKAEFPHYDICQSMRKIAVQNGAIEVTMREMVKMIQARRKPQPEEISWK